MPTVLFVRISSDLEPGELSGRLLERKPRFLEVPGPLQKVYGRDPVSGDPCGIYFFGSGPPSTRSVRAGWRRRSPRRTRRLTSAVRSTRCCTRYARTRTVQRDPRRSDGAVDRPPTGPCSGDAGSTSRTRPSTRVTTTSLPGARSSGPRASQTSPSSFTCPRGAGGRTTTAVRPTSVSTPTTALRRLDQRTKTAVSPTSTAAARPTARAPHGEGSTVRASTIAAIVSTNEAYGLRRKVSDFESDTG